MATPIFQHYSKGQKLSAREYNRAIDLLAGVANSLHIEGFVDSSGFHTRRLPVSISEDVTKIYAKITQTLSRGDVLQGIEEIDHYKIKIMGEIGISEWKVGQDYTIGTIIKITQDSEVTYRGCIKKHTSNNSDKKWNNNTYWEDSAGDIDAWVSGYSENLLYTIPWFQVDEIVEVAGRQDFDEDGQPTGETVWYILETVMRTEEIVENERHYSLLWNQDEKRAMAVFS